MRRAVWRAGRRWVLHLVVMALLALAALIIGHGESNTPTQSISSSDNTVSAAAAIESGSDNRVALRTMFLMAEFLAHLFRNVAQSSIKISDFVIRLFPGAI